MPTNRRIFWSSEEKSAVLATARDLRSREPRLTLKQVGTKAQGTLPKHRRRPVNNKLSTWLSTGLKGSTPKPANVSRPATAKGAPLQTATITETPAQSSMLQTLIDNGAAILSGILSHPSVRNGLGSAL